MSDLFGRRVNMRGFPYESLPADVVADLENAARVCRALAVAMTTRANSGHPAGSLSSMKMYMAAYGVANLTPDNAADLDRDYIAISHGHTSPAAYATLAYYGFVDGLDAVREFRRCGSLFQGHVERDVPGIDWSSGDLGQGLSAGAGFALAQTARKNKSRVYVLMGDGEQGKGQLAEARRLIAARNLPVTALIDANDIQISGRVEDVMPIHLRQIWEADGWQVIECDGDNFPSLYAGLRQASLSDRPTVLICRTTMGQGVSFMEDRPDYHGKAATGDLYRQAMDELKAPDLVAMANSSSVRTAGAKMDRPRPALNVGAPRVYKLGEKVDCRSGFGNALSDVGAATKENGGGPLLVFDCDLAGSVKTADFSKKFPEWFVQGGIQEHSTATAAGSSSIAGAASVFAGFGMFALVEAYNQQRLNDINETNLTLALTHVGLDVGEDGKTHQCIDYVALAANCFGWKLIVPADANQTDRALRWAVQEGGNVCLAMGRSKLPVLELDGRPAFEKPFVYGDVVRLREGKNGAILALGAMANQALEAALLLAQKGIQVSVYSVSCPLVCCDETLKEAFETGAVLTLEDHNARTGMGSLWLARASELGLTGRALRLGVTHYGMSGPSSDVYAQMELDGQSVAERFARLIR